ncbi:adenylate/guanylate cyclase domain-containing protein [Azotobacter chroococcum]|nr:adenylate/guanylate cyclase domain-containing protein [Azotobacter chroococcum]
MRGFTGAAARLAPDELIALLGEYQGLLLPILKAHGGSIDKFMGDGILASFGAVSPDPAFAAQALRAVDAIWTAVGHWRAQRQAAGLPAPDVGAGLASGEVVFGIIGHGQRLEYTLIGDAVNLAAKLEKHNKVEHSRGLTTRTTYQLARAQGYAGSKELRAARRVGGVAAPLDLAVLG